MKGLLYLVFSQKYGLILLHNLAQFCKIGLALGGVVYNGDFIAIAKISVYTEQLICLMRLRFFHSLVILYHADTDFI